jgi:hypothetical protein
MSPTVATRAAWAMDVGRDAQARGLGMRAGRMTSSGPVGGDRRTRVGQDRPGVRIWRSSSVEAAWSIALDESSAVRICW